VSISGIDGQQIARLHELVHEAQRYVERPWEPGETARPLTFYTNHLPEEGWELGWSLVNALYAQQPDLFESFSEITLHANALDAVLGAEEVPTVEEMAKALQAQAAEEAGKWIIAVPLANTTLPRPWLPVGSTAALRRAWDATGHDREAWGLSEEDTQAEFEIRDHLGDRLNPPTRFMPPREEQPVDTRRFASLILVEDGVVKQIAVEKATAKARYAVATWALLAPAEQHHLLPAVATWWPHPHTRQTPEHRRFDHEFMTKERRHGGDIWEYTPYELPEDLSVIAAPFTAFEKIERRSAQALLSNTATLYDAARGSRAQLASRIRDVMAAIECLCEEKPRATNAFERWEQLAVRIDPWKRLAEVRSYRSQHIEALQERLRFARNIGTHGADAALLNLGWTAGDRQVGKNVVI